MLDLTVIVYPTEATAESARQRLAELQKEYLIRLGSTLLATRTESGKIKLKQLPGTAASGAESAFGDLLIGALFLSPVKILTSDSASGALDALTEAGLSDAFVKRLSDSLDHGGSALVLLVHFMTADKMLEEIEGFGGVALKTPIDKAMEQMLRDALRSAPGR